MDRTISIGQGQFRVLESGAGAPLLFIHGFPLGAEMWAPQLEAVPQGWRFIAPDLRGFGGSTDAVLPAATSLDDHVADLLGLLDHLEISQTVLAGLSMGGYIAQAFLRTAPGRVRAAALCDTRAEGDSAEARENRSQMRAGLARQGPSAVADAMLPKMIGKSSQASRPELTRYVRTMIERNTPEGLDAALVALMSRPDHTASLGAIRCPVLLIAGEEDDLTPVASHETMRRAVAGSSLTTIPGAGHLSNLERPDLFNAALHAFLATLPPPREVVT